MTLSLPDSIRRDTSTVSSTTSVNNVLFCALYFNVKHCTSYWNLGPEPLGMLLRNCGLTILPEIQYRQPNQPYRQLERTLIFKEDDATLFVTYKASRGFRSFQITLSAGCFCEVLPNLRCKSWERWRTDEVFCRQRQSSWWCRPWQINTIILRQL